MVITSLFWSKPLDICCLSSACHYPSLITDIVFSILAIGLYQLSLRLPTKLEILAIISARTAIFLINFGFWVDSLWGQCLTLNIGESEIIIANWVFGVIWAIVLLVNGIWAWKQNKR